MKKLLLMVTLAISSLGAGGQVIIVSGCADVSGPYTLSGTDLNGRNIYSANHSCSYCNPQEISYSNANNRWELKSKHSWSPNQPFAYNTDQSSPNPPLTGWINAPELGNKCPNMVISLPGTIESKNCTDCLWSDPDTWESDVVPGENNHVVVNGKVILDVNATTLDLKINSSKSLETINNKSLTIKGFFENEGFLNVSGLELQKSQSLDGSKVSLQSLSAYGNITLTSHLEVLRPEVSNTDNVYLYGSGTITLGNYDLTCHGVYINLPAQQRSRVITNGTGALKFKVPAGSVNKEFVIGRI